MENQGTLLLKSLLQPQRKLLRPLDKSAFKLHMPPLQTDEMPLQPTPPPEKNSRPQRPQRQPLQPTPPPEKNSLPQRPQRQPLQPTPPPEKSSRPQRPQRQPLQLQEETLKTTLSDLNDNVLNKILRYVRASDTGKTHLPQVSQEFLRLHVNLTPEEKEVEAAKIYNFDCPVSDEIGGNAGMLERCCASGKTSHVTRLLKETPINNTVVLNGIAYAVMFGHKDTVEAMIKYIDLIESITNSFKAQIRTKALMWGVEYLQVDIVEMLVSKPYLEVFQYTHIETLVENIIPDDIRLKTNRNEKKFETHNKSVDILKLVIASGGRVTRELLLSTIEHANMSALKILMTSKNKDLCEDGYKYVDVAVDSMELFEKYKEKYTYVDSVQYSIQVLQIIFDEIENAKNQTATLEEFKIYALMYATKKRMIKMCDALITHFKVDITSVSSKENEQKSALRIAIDNYSPIKGYWNALYLFSKIDLKIQSKSSKLYCDEIRYAIEKNKVDVIGLLANDYKVEDHQYRQGIVNILNVVKLPDLYTFIYKAVETDSVYFISSVMYLCHKILSVLDIKNQEHIKDLNAYALQVAAKCNYLGIMEVMFNPEEKVLKNLQVSNPNTVTRLEQTTALEFAITGIPEQQPLVLAAVRGPRHHWYRIKSFEEMKIESVKFLLSKGAKVTPKIIDIVTKLEVSNQLHYPSEMYKEIYEMLLKKKNSSFLNRFLYLLNRSRGTEGPSHEV
jgi:hypothetical protein